METWKKRAVELLSALSLSYENYPGVVPYTPQKNELVREEKKSLRRALPERHGVASGRILDLLSELEGEDRANPHSIIILKGGEVIAECSRRGYSVSQPHLSHSMTKTVMGMIIGLLWDDGLIDLDALATDILGVAATKKHQKITVRHLLTMSTGVGFGEAGSVTESAWTEAFFASDVGFAPGEEFAYNSMNSYILARIADKIIHKKYNTDVSEYARKRLFAPLGITNYLWEIGPEGVVKGGWGLYASAEAWAKLGIMMLYGGTYGGKRILSGEWVSSSIFPHRKTPDEVGDYDYGYHLWVGKDGEDFLFNGMLGQNVWVCPKNDIVVAINSGNNELFSKSPALEVVKRYLGGELNDRGVRIISDIFKLKDKCNDFFSRREYITFPKAKKRLLPFLPQKRQDITNEFEPLFGSYSFVKNNQGLLPLFVRVMQNNFCGGLREMDIKASGGKLIFTFTEGENSYTIPVGLYKHEESSVNFCGEQYKVLAGAIAESDGNGKKYRLEILFPELPNERRITLIPTGMGALDIQMNELPNSKVAFAFMDGFPDSGRKNNFFIDLIEKHLGKSFIESKLKEAFDPALVAAKKGTPDYESILASGNEAMEQKIASSALIRSLINRFVSTGGEEKPTQNPANIISGIFGKLFGLR